MADFKKRRYTILIPLTNLVNKIKINKKSSKFQFPAKNQRLFSVVTRK
jgi:hypothetical protein